MGHHIKTEDVVTATSSYQNNINQANHYLQQNDIGAAYPFVMKAAQSADATESILIDAALLAVSLDKLNDAVEFFNAALKKNPDNMDTRYNLALANLNRGAYPAAISLLEQILELQPDRADIYNDLAVIAFNQNQPGQAFSRLDQAMKLAPDFSLAINNRMQYFLDNEKINEGITWLQQYQDSNTLPQKTILELKRWGEIFEQKDSGPIIESEEPVAMPEITNARIAVFAGMRSFIEDITQHLGEKNEIRYFEGKTVAEMLELLEWSDIAWFEWCDQFLIEATKLPKVTKIICRLHSYEVFTDMPAQIDWQKVDQLIFVNDSVKELYERKFKNNVAKTVIHNGVNQHKFTFDSQRAYGKKIASVGYINYKKNPALLLYLFKKIHAYDNEFTLHIAGEHQDPRLELYFEHFLKENPLPVHFYGWVEDMPEWYADKDFIISTSLFESFHYSIAEGMCRGLMPLIHHWYGADYLYPKRHLFTDPDDCLRLIKEYERMDKSAVAVENRAYIIDNYNAENKHRQISALLHSWHER